MAILPQPFPGLVIHYSYLWRDEHLQGREEGRKDRPCAIVAAIRKSAEETHVLVLPITHLAPKDAADAVEIPLKVKQRLGLDDARSWVVLTEWNAFVWPGPDLRPAPGRDDRSFAHGVLPPGLFTIIRERLLDLVQKGAVAPVPRTR